jgi:hypothetical protein
VSGSQPNGDDGVFACGACGHVPALPGQDRCDRCAAYDNGYRDGLSDVVFELVWPMVARSARLTDPDDLSYALGRAVAVGEARQQAPPTPTNGQGH